MVLFPSAHFFENSLHPTVHTQQGGGGGLSEYMGVNIYTHYTLAATGIQITSDQVRPPQLPPLAGTSQPTTSQRYDPES